MARDMICTVLTGMIRTVLTGMIRTVLTGNDNKLKSALVATGYTLAVPSCVPGILFMTQP